MLEEVGWELCAFYDLVSEITSGSDDEESACNAEDSGSIPGSGRSPEREMATHSRILAWKIPWTTVHRVAKELGMAERLPL